MPSKPTGFPFGAASAQSPFPAEMLDALYWIVIVLALLFFAGIVLIIVRRFSSKAGGLADTRGLDVDFIDRAERKGALTKEEMRRVREAMVRRALESQQKAKTTVTVRDLETQIRTGLPLADKIEGAVSPRARKPAAAPSLAPRRDKPRAPEPAAQPTRGEASDAVDMKALLDRGLIDQEEYDRLTSLARRMKEKDAADPA